MSEQLQPIADWLTSSANLTTSLVILGAVAILGSLELIAPAFKQHPKRSERWPANFGLMLVNWSLAALVPISAITAAELANTGGYGLLNWLAVPAGLGAMLTLIIYSLALYLLHVLDHKSRMLWRIHRVHHLDTHLDLSTAGRHHPLELALGLAVGVSVAVAFGLQPEILAIYMLCEVSVSAVAHANLRLPGRLDRLLSLVFVTPNMHSVHHSATHLETDSNYGDVFSIWDRIFGTYREVPKERYDTMLIGLKEVRDERASDFWWQLKSPLLLSLPRTESAIRAQAPHVTSPLSGSPPPS
jgi:sterol desaturase/sphingolipid hydroxylase (fatty acid hydroxylase superfamily)